MRVNWFTFFGVLTISCILSCSSTKTVLNTASFGEFLTHHPISLTVEVIAKDLDSQLVSFKSMPLVVEGISRVDNNEKDELGKIISTELKNSLARLGHIVFDEVTTTPGRASPNYDIESAQIYVNGRYFPSMKRLVINVNALDLKTNIILASSSASVLRTSEIDELIKRSNRRGLIKLERVPLKNFL